MPYASRSDSFTSSSATGSTSLVGKVIPARVEFARKTTARIRRSIGRFESLRIVVAFFIMPSSFCGESSMTASMSLEMLSACPCIQFRPIGGTESAESPRIVFSAGRIVSASDSVLSPTDAFSACALFFSPVIAAIRTEGVIELSDTISESGCNAVVSNLPCLLLNSPRNKAALILPLIEICSLRAKTLNCLIAVSVAFLCAFESAIDSKKIF